MFQLFDLSQSRDRAREEVKEKEEEKQQMKEGLRAALEEMSKLNLLLQVQHIPARIYGQNMGSIQVNQHHCVLTVGVYHIKLSTITLV